MAEEEKYSQLSEAEERFYIAGTFIGGTIAILSAVFIIGRYIYIGSIKRMENKYYRIALRIATIAAFFPIISGLIMISMGNNLIIPWKNDSKLVSISDSLIVSSSAIGRMLFYFSFTFHLQSLLQTDKMTLFLKIWMSFVLFAYIIITTLFIIDDSMNHSTKEIGTGSYHNFKIAMYLGHDGADIAQHLMITLVLVDVTYFMVILYYFINSLKLLPNASENGIKGVILIGISAVIFYIGLIADGFELDFKYLWAFLPVIVDNVCLSLMFKENNLLYNGVCGALCDKCCIECIYGSEYESVETMTSDTDDA